MSSHNFELNQKSKQKDLFSADPKQLAFSDLVFKIPQVEFIESSKSTAYDFSSWTLHRKLSYQEVSKKYFGISLVIHAILASAVLFLSVPLIKESQKEIITIEIKDTSGSMGSHPTVALKAKEAAAPLAAPELIATKPTQKAAPKIKVAAPQIKEQEENEIIEPVIKLKPIAPVKIVKDKAHAVAKPTPAIKVVAKTTQKVAAKAPPTAHSRPAQVLAEESPVVIPETLDDIKSQDLDESVAHAAANTKLAADSLPNDVENDFQKVDHQTKALIEGESQQLGALAKDAENETNENLKSIEDQSKAELAAIQEANAQRRKQEAQAIAAARASENAQARENAARAAAAEEAALARAAAAAKAAADAEGSGKGDAVAAAGTPGEGEIRSLQDMRQMPGNPKPAYDYQERLRGDAGEVIFLAYVTRDGSTTQFKLSKSTGHRNLDLKTLKALKKWKFYPGQEGWVEFPFRWDLQGGPKEMPTLLRRSK